MNECPIEINLKFLRGKKKNLSVTVGELLSASEKDYNFKYSYEFHKIISLIQDERAIVSREIKMINREVA